MSALAVGDAAPDFDLAADGGGRVRLSDLSGKTVVLYLYPKDDTPGCTKEAQGFSAAAAEFAKAGAVVVGLSKDSVASHDKFKKKYDLNLHLASDPEGALIEALGSWVEKSMYGKVYFGIDRSTFLIDKAGRIARILSLIHISEPTRPY